MLRRCSAEIVSDFAVVPEFQFRIRETGNRRCAATSIPNVHVRSKIATAVHAPLAANLADRNFVLTKCAPTHFTAKYKIIRSGSCTLYLPLKRRDLGFSVESGLHTQSREIYISTRQKAPSHYSGETETGHRRWQKQINNDNCNLNE